MKLLAIDTSGLVATVAILVDDSILAEYSVNYKKTHSETLMPMINEIVSITETDIKEFDAIAIAGGPGSFTGLRIGSATAKGIAEVLDIPIVSVPTVDALAYNLWGTSDYIVPMMDARRNQTYTGIYEIDKEGNLIAELEQSAISVEELANKINELGRPVVMLGDGVDRFKPDMDELLTVEHRYAPASMNRQRAASVAMLGAAYYKEGKYTSAAEHAPEYLRKSQAERERENKECSKSAQ
ncbi:tRNA (adenosine(37)-N6)-threonylcarbamoyltransferase complex dimerization subunit type 1 TsaB [Lachnospiraceae bacterium C1.1]|nr:tRNA (adenosine(37)-N6)-threonylcarbamoyltransferase complex dimerization subunit type 1 TsaB [Lachnospiraceae bacterium C1.1]